MNKAGLFGGGWEDYLDALNEAFDRHVAENMPPHPFGASVDAIMTGYPDDAGGSLLFGSLEHAADFPNAAYASGGVGSDFPGVSRAMAQPPTMNSAPNSMTARATGEAPMLATPVSNSVSPNSGSAFGMDSGGLGPQSGLQIPRDNRGGLYPDSAAFLEQQGVGKSATQHSLDNIGSDSVQPRKGNAGNSTINSNRVEQALSGTGYMVDGQHVGTAGLLAAAKAGKPAIEGVGKALGPIGLGLDIAENAARAHAEIQAGADPHKAAAEAAGRVIARNGIVYGTEAVTGVLATLASLNPALGAALGVAAGAGAGVAADKSGLTDWAGRTLAPIL